MTTDDRQFLRRMLHALLAPANPEMATWRKHLATRAQLTAQLFPEKQEEKPW
jgi:hypothetical protein